MKTQNAIVRTFADMNPEVLATAEMLANKYDPLLDVETLGAILGIKPNSVVQNISAERFPVLSS